MPDKRGFPLGGKRVDAANRVPVGRLRHSGVALVRPYGFDGFDRGV